MHTSTFMYYLHILESWLLILLIVLILTYVILAFKHPRGWSRYRICAFVSGMILIIIFFSSVFSHLLHEDFRWHMVGHLVLGMLSPLLIALSHPMTLLLSQLPTQRARVITRLMRSKYVTFITHPAVAMLLNIGGLYIIYLTPVFQWMHEYILVYVIIHLHIFFAGLIFTLSILRLDVQAHRHSLIYRAVVLIIALGLHKALCKFIYGSPPANVPIEEAHQGAMIMYYGGDGIDLIIILLLCYEWYKRQSRKTIHQKLRSEESAV